MNLQTRVLLGYAYLVALLLLTAITSVVAFQRLSSGIDRILGENFAAVTIAMQVLEEIERQDSATLTALLTRVDSSEELERSDHAVRSLIEQAEGLIKVPEERALLDDFAAHYTRLTAQRRDLLDNIPEDPRAAYDDRLAEPFHDTKLRLYALLDANHVAMLQADEDARTAARNASVALGLIVILALLSMGYLSRALQVEFLQRLAEAREVATAIASGDRGRRMAAERNDELGLLARQLNLALDRQQETEQRVRGELNQQRQLLLAMMDARTGGSALLGLDGELVAASCPDRMLSRLEPVSEWVREQGRRDVMAMDKVTPVERTFVSKGLPDLKTTLLIAPPSRPVGWLIEAQPRRRRSSAALTPIPGTEPTPPEPAPPEPIPEPLPGSTDPPPPDPIPGSDPDPPTDPPPRD